ncbi:hypothetical protein N7457_005769 [Penicillium paradoxum]|uniref:uncharacterized protein n=1 Tax=Penicillium paradoxum TaxID=176176 RepID=UPI002546BC4D|nr:uncharacterized protein N7457_005769 [Penicillium paradoxum]KAJ5780609.1 hypothetical protein N7457_005769 [Penicillium paradoxum]
MELLHLAACVRYDFVTKLASAKEDYYILLADSSNWCTIEAYIAIFCGSAPSLFVLIKTYIPAIFGSTTARYPTTMQSARASYLQRRGPPRRNRRQGLRDTTLGSQDAIIPVSNPDSDQNGIIVKTDIEMHVVTGKSTEDKAHTTQHYNFSRPI